MHTTQAVIPRLENGRVKPSTRTLERLAVATGMRLWISFEPAPGAGELKVAERVIWKILTPSHHDLCFRRPAGTRSWKTLLGKIKRKPCQPTRSRKREISKVWQTLHSLRHQLKASSAI
jgi:hypothetical protein